MRVVWRVVFAVVGWCFAADGAVTEVVGAMTAGVESRHTSSASPGTATPRQVPQAGGVGSCSGVEHGCRYSVLMQGVWARKRSRVSSQGVMVSWPVHPVPPQRGRMPLAGTSPSVPYAW
jgi:hypothetical protein